MALVAGGGIEPDQAAARQADASFEALTLTDLLGDSDLVHPDVAEQVEVDRGRLSPSAWRFVEARTAEADAARRLATAVAGLGSTAVAREVLAEELAVARARESTRRALADDAAGDLSDYAIHAFVEGEQVDFDGRELADLQLDGSPDPEHRLTQEVGGLLHLNLEEAEAAHVDAAADLAELEQHDERLATREASLERDRQRADGDLAEARELVVRFRPQFESDVMQAPVEGLGFPLVVLDAYYQAERSTAERRPGCELRWFQLAGIGRVESHHGSYGGSAVGRTGRTTREILGPVLDGTEFQAIADTDGGEFDGDTTWDRAVGPMQFIPGSWRIFGQDGNGDGSRDPHNIYDAALAAAEHLCRSHGGFSASANFRRALLGYNRSVVYGSTVMEQARVYDSAVELLPIERDADGWATGSGPGSGLVAASRRAMDGP